MERLLDQIKQLAEKEPKTLEQMALKLSEESGEVAQSVLSYTKASGNQYKQLTINDIKEECIDTLLVSLALYFKLADDPDTELSDILDKKIIKWQNYINN
ncbi:MULTISPECIES: MazG-like family protein [Vagococcus]|uniref:NTP pyrophosphohydrolase MazG putative catalytic core domain-containing protein n=1 Tax=Vagococcus fluvialis bH819 TaxID=1255619 RepID=A0A1X6WRN3_9ENTE|nr:MULTISPECIES: MazG-like family protein [Vagococcus]SLM86954.1 hypothetical protein FM121_12730 [Vagococcus fluvialis bH819]HCM88956.1 hypothetical protein [Vagococcus sp.]